MEGVPSVYQPSPTYQPVSYTHLQILVLDEGRIVSRGRHAELLASCPEYREIAKSQLSERDLAMAETSTKGGDV